MNRNKRQRNTVTDDYDDDTKKKSQCISLCLPTVTNTSRHSITHFEDLSNELIYEIFEFLDAYNLYEIFFHLNIRFRKVCIHSNLPIQINISSISKSTFQNHYTYFIKPNKHRINSIHLSDPFIIEFFSSPIEDISKCSQLQTLILDNIESQYLENLLNCLVSLSNLTSLTIPISYNSNKTEIYNLIFQLPVLKTCKLSFEELVYVASLPRSTNSSSPIEQLTINAKLDHTLIDTLLSYVPQLRRLSIKYIYGYYNRGPRVLSTVLKNLKHVSLTLDHFGFDQFEPLIKQYFGQVKVLYISSNYDYTYLNGVQWERLILSYMPYLHIFDLQHTYEISYRFKHENIYQHLIEKFTSPFWSQRKCFFAYDYNSGRSSLGFFYSVQPYRRKYFTLTSESSLDKDACDEKIVFDSVHHVIIQDEKIVSNCSKYFPNTNELTISDQRIDRARRSSTEDSIDRIIPLVKLTKLTIDYSHRSFSKVIDLLYVTPNVHTLVFKRLSLVGTDYLPLQKSEKFRLVSNQNKIKQLTILFDYSLWNIQLFINLCPKLQQISLGISNSCFYPAVHFLLSETNKPIGHLSSICIFGVDTIIIENLITLIKSEKPLGDCSIKIIDKMFFIWC